MPFRYFEDFTDGEEIDLGTHPIKKQEAVEFAEEFDPAPFHLSEEGGENSMHGRLIASGWHTCAITQRLLCDGLLLQSSGQGSPGLDKVQWLRPVYPGQTLKARATVLSKRLSSSRPGVGLVLMRFESFTDSQDPVLTMEGTIMFATKETAMSSSGKTA